MHVLFLVISFVYLDFESLYKTSDGIEIVQESGNKLSSDYCSLLS